MRKKFLVVTPFIIFFLLLGNSFLYHFNPTIFAAAQGTQSPTVSNAIVGTTTKAQTNQLYTQVILDLFNGQQHFSVPHVYQGDCSSAPTNQWPVYYRPNNASQYWSPVSTIENQADIIATTQDSSQNDSGGYVKYTLDLLNNSLINGNFVNSLNTNNNINPEGIAYDPSNGYIYVANYGTNTVSVINGANNSVIANINVGYEPMGIAYDPSNGYIYVANEGSNDVSVINGANNSVIANINVGGAPTGIAYDPSNGYIYVTISVLDIWNYILYSQVVSNYVSVINGANNSVIANINVGGSGGPTGIAYDPSNGYIYVANFDSGTVSVINGANNSVIANINVGYEPMGIAYDPSNGYIYVANEGSNDVSVINGANNSVIANINVGGAPTGIAYDPSNGYIYVANSGTNTVSVINGANNSVIANINVGYEPSGVAYDPSNGYIYVTNTDSGTISIISTSTQVTKIYTVTFTESGLPPETSWSVTLNGTTKSSTTIIFTMPNGEYNYSVASPILVNGVEYAATVPLGSVIVNNTNVTVVVHYAPLITTEKLEVYSEFVKYFYSGFNLPNKFFVTAPSINGSQPSSVTGYIMGANTTLSFTYNSSSGYWVSSEVNMGGLKFGSYKLTVYAVYGNNYVVEGAYNVTVLEPPHIVLTILSYTPISNQAFNLKLNNLGKSNLPLSIEYEWSLKNNITGLFNNEYEIEANVNLNYMLEQDVPVHYLSGNYSTFLEFPIFVTLNSNGVVNIGGGISRNLVLSFGPVNAAFKVGGSAQGNFAIDNYQEVVLQSVDASTFLSAYGTYNVPTLLGVSIDGVDIGFVVSISLGASAQVNTVLVPVNNSSGAIPLAINDVTGNVFVPFAIEGTVGASVVGVGAGGGLQGVAGVGFLLQPGGSSLLESPGGAMVGDVNTFALANLVILNYQGSLTILGPGVLYEWGSVSQSNITLLEGELNQAAQQFQWQVNGSDWVNGSVFGIITNNTRFGYGYSITRYDGLVYVYYTELTPSGVAVIRGLAFNGTTAMRAPLPAFNDLGEASPLLVKLDNGSLMSIWAGVPMGHYGLDNLTILLQGSVLRNGAWGGPSNLTTSGDAMSYASDGEYIYLVHEPELSLTYNNTVLEELTPSGGVVKVLNIPGIIGITGARSGLVVAQFVNGTYALINMNTGGVEPINASIAGFSGGLLYYFYNGTLTVINGTQRSALNLPVYAYAFPVAWSHGLVIVAWRPGLLSAFNWNGTALQPIGNYTTAFTIIPRAVIINNALYLAWFGLENVTNGYGSIYMAILSLTHPTNQSTTTTATYTITFTESGLPPGTQWSVTFNGLTNSSTANSITFTGVLAGNYTWNASSIIAVGSGTRYAAQTSSGTISVPTASSVSLYYVKQYSVTVGSTAGGSTSPSGTSWYNAGSTVNITAIPTLGYKFAGWETNSSITFTNSSSATTNAMVNSAGTIVASFKAVPSSTQPSYTMEYAAAAVVVVIVILVAVLLMRRRGK